MATITLDAGAAIELADILDLLAEWIAEDDHDAFAGHGYNHQRTQRRAHQPPRPQFTLDTT